MPTGPSAEALHRGPPASCLAAEVRPDLGLSPFRGSCRGRGGALGVTKPRCGNEASAPVSQSVVVPQRP